MGKEIIFYYDIICPYAYLASKLIGDIASRNGAKLIWRPVLLGGIYKNTKPDHVNIPDNSMIKTYSGQKKRMLAQDLAVQYSHQNVSIPGYHIPETRTLNAMRLLASTPSESDELRTQLTHTLFDAVWKFRKDVSDLKVLQDVASSVNYDINVKSLVDNKSHLARQTLIDNTDEVVKRGGFGVPSMWVNGKLYFGNDRLFRVEQELGNINAKPHRMLTKPVVKKKAKLTVYFDFVSPWSYIGFKQIPALLNSSLPVDVEVEYVPILLGVILKSIGTPDVPALYMGDNKRNYIAHDMQEWLTDLNFNNFNFSSHFPMRTILALRLALAKPEYKMLERIFDAAWCENEDISDEKVLSNILSSAGYNFQQLLQDATKDDIKLKLRENNERALEAGVCGVPCFQVDDGPLLFGQDRLNVIADMLMGWEVSFLQPASKL